MDISPEEFNNRFKDTVDNLLVAMAEHTDIPPDKFYSMACILENLAYFSPVIYGAIRESKESNTNID